MYNENNTLSPAEIELISNVSGAYAAPFWDGVREVSGTLEPVRKLKAVLETLCSTGNELEAYNHTLLYEIGLLGCFPSPHLSPSKLPVLPEKEKLQEGSFRSIAKMSRGFLFGL